MRIQQAIIAIAFFLLALSSATAQNKDLGELNEPRQTDQAQSTQVERFQDWGVRCSVTKGNGEKTCKMFQVVTYAETGKQVMAVVVGHPQQLNQPVAVFRLPLGIRLPPGIRLSVTGEDPITFPVQICLPQGCRAHLLLKDALVDKLRAGLEATVTIRGPQGRRIDLPLSLMGFTAALERVTP